MPQDFQNLSVLFLIRQKGLLAAGADGGVLQVERALHHGGCEAEGVEIGAEIGIDRLLAFSLGDIMRR